MTWSAGDPGREDVSSRVVGSRRAEVLALMAIVVCLLVELWILPVGIDNQDEGHFAEQAMRVLGGQVPYRDFDSLYTPGLLYTHAGLFAALGGPSLLGLRVLTLLARAGLALGLYALARPLARPFWAALPALYVLIGLDRAPGSWEPHPGWLSMLWTVVAVWLFARLPSLGRGHQALGLGAVGAMVGLTFLFKQNAGVFLGLVVAGFVLLQGLEAPSRPVTPALRTAQVLLVGAVLGALLWMVRPHPQIGIPLVLYLLGPAAATGALLACSSPVSRSGVGLISRVGLLLPLAAGFVVVTLPWIVALAAALDGQIRWLAGFVGAVDQVPLALPPEMPRQAGWMTVLGIGLSAIAVVYSRGLVRLVPILLTCQFTLFLVQLTRESGEPFVAAILLAPGRAGDGLQALVPVAALWAGLWLSRRRPQSLADWRLRWYLAAGAFTFLTQYPRMDNFHLIWSACIPLVVGAVSLSRLHDFLRDRWLLGALESKALAAAIVIIPLLTALPNLYSRSEPYLEPDPVTGGVRLVPQAALAGLPVVSGLVVPPIEQDRLVALRDYIRATTGPTEPILVYPTSALIYLIVERPNPIRYSHLYPGAAPPEELARVMATLEAIPVRTVVVDNQGFLLWPTPGANTSLEEYLSARFEERARFGGYRVLYRIDRA